MNTGHRMTDRKTWEGRPACDPRVADVIQAAGIKLRDATPEMARQARYYLDCYYWTDVAAERLRRELDAQKVWP